MPRLLLIEDEIGAIAALKRVLARAGHEVLVATNLPDALSTIEHEQPDALLVAAGLQGESAASLVEAIRAIDANRPLIVMGDGLGSGEPFLSKPVEPSKLIALLHELIPEAAPPPPSHEPAALSTPIPTAVPDTLATPSPSPPTNIPASGATAPDLARRRELVSKTLAEAQARRQAAEAARARAPKPPEARPLFASPRPVPTPAATVNLAQPLPTKPDFTPSPPEAEKPASVPVPKPKADLAPAPPTTGLEERPSPRRSLEAELFGDAVQQVAPRQAPAPESEPRPEKLLATRRPQPSETLEIPRSGTLDALEPVALVLACHRARLSGQVKLEQGMVQRVLFFDEGRLAGAASSSPDERLEALSYRRGLISREQQRLLRSEAQIPTRRLALLMVERAYLKPAELFPLVQERVEEVIYEAFGAFHGKYQILAEPVPDDERVALSRSPLALATEGIRRKYLMERLLSGLGGPSTLLRPARGPELAEYGLTARERRLAQSIDGLRNIEELLFESGNEPLPGLKILYALVMGRSVEVAMRGLPSAASSEIEARIDLTRVAEKYEQVRSGNYFEVLGVSSSATAYEIEQSYDRLAREFQPGRFQELRNPELPGQLDEIQRLLAEARDILIDEGLREEYRAHLRR